MQSSEKIIIALDFESGAEALKLVELLGPTAPFYKVGLQLLSATGAAVVRELVAQQKKVFLDLKIHEIPNSVVGAVAAAGALGASMVTVHASGGSAVLRAAVEAARSYPALSVLAVTVITSMRQQDLAEVGVVSSVEEQVVRLAKLAASAGCHGVVASPQEAKILREVLASHMLIVTPGAQLSTDAKNDQARTATPFEAIRLGATHLVIGRSITRSQNPRATFESIRKQIEEASAPKST